MRGYLHTCIHMRGYLHACIHTRGYLLTWGDLSAHFVNVTCAFAIRLCGARCVVHGVWYTVCVVHGVWCTVLGTRCVVHSVWCTVCGTQCSPSF